MKSTGSWGMMAILLRRSSRPICAILISSMIMEPPVSSTSLNRAAPREDFPARTQKRCCMKKCVHELKKSFKNKLLPGERKGSLLPDPVRPTMPMVSSGWMVKDSFFRTRGRLSRYLMSTSWKEILPCWGHEEAGAAASGLCRGASLSRDCDKEQWW